LKRVLLSGVLILVIFLTVFRQRVFLRDPLGKVERAGVVQDGSRLYINYSNDVLVEDAAHQFVLVQNWNKSPGTPLHLACLNGLACWTDANEAAVSALDRPTRAAAAVMSSKEVTFLDGGGEEVRIELR
jgi:hypothetical protein